MEEDADFLSFMALWEQEPLASPPAPSMALLEQQQTALQEAKA